ncbi:succinylglutamate-semialdehyde dehydrogenase [Ketobacter sp. MCCC 1A13808]|uniref:succinylglutamate-semialdehyde dehydrogenase n=1 Tax=Ketobacter sp. MCCC 1A13808 TaxID=2602738 RepID=UPI0012EC7E8B|nr:succinylglutamate-semialdehyde dehydrogenase [Ketobacter sp. MCCC 1A13808]MVF12200.1 succinylglutamate-semialdehyde dehydrogenase [Ketobacter sp. MCCC 1A13808]
MNNAALINNEWLAGAGADLVSLNPLTDAVIWQGPGADRDQVAAAVEAARTAFSKWRKTSLADRVDIVNRYTELLSQRKVEFSKLITQENGKPLWDAESEVNAMLAKTAISLRALQERTSTTQHDTAAGMLSVRHRPHGVLAVFGPFNFPGHLPNGHILPAILAGNCVVFKPSELTPGVAEEMCQLWVAAGLPPGVFNLVQGDKVTGSALIEDPQLDGILFTGSAQTGHYLHKQFAGHPEKVLALEMGGNNPLVIDQVGNAKAAMYLSLFSAFVSSGQRCTCARRLMLPDSRWGDQFVEDLIHCAKNLVVADGFAQPQPFMGTVISKDAVAHLNHGIQLLNNIGGTTLLQSQYGNPQQTLMSPCIVDMSTAQQNYDEELFGPVLQLYRYRDLEHALTLCNDTRFGLAAGIVTEQPETYQVFADQVRAGIVNCNKPLVGASSSAPFGGIGASGNFNPGAYYAADYCAYPVASLTAEEPQSPAELPPGMTL